MEVEEKRNKIKRYILSNYNASKDETTKLSKFLDYLFKDYDIEDKLYEDIKEDLEDNDEIEEDDTTFEIREYRNNVLGGNW